MTRDEIIAMAKKAGFVFITQRDGSILPEHSDLIEDFAALVAAATLARTSPTLVLEAKDIDPAILRELLSKHEPPYVAAAVAAEREACAKVCEEERDRRVLDTSRNTARTCAAAIRARGAQ